MAEEMKTEELVDLGVKASIEQVSSLYKEISEKLQREERLFISCKDVEQVDVSILQLLYAAKREADKLGKKLELSGPVSESMRKALVDSGFLPSYAEEPVDISLEMMDFDQ